MIKSHPGLKPLEEVDSEMSELIAQEQRRQACAPRPKPSFVERGGRARPSLNKRFGTPLACLAPLLLGDELRHLAVDLLEGL